MLTIVRFIVSATKFIGFLALLLVVAVAILRREVPRRTAEETDVNNTKTAQLQVDLIDTEKTQVFKAVFGQEVKKPAQENPVTPSATLQESNLPSSHYGVASESPAKPATITQMLPAIAPPPPKPTLVETVRVRLPCGSIVEASPGSVVACPSCGQRCCVPTSTVLSDVSNLASTNGNVRTSLQIEPSLEANNMISKGMKIPARKPLQQVQMVRVQLPCGRFVRALPGSTVTCPSCGKQCNVPRSKPATCCCPCR